jgi:hypothetical protein
MIGRQRPRDARFPRSRPWSSSALLDGLDASLAGAELTRHAELLWYDTVTEHDSQHFLRYVESLRGAGVTFCADFLAFENAWIVDERNHYDGYRRLLSLASGRPELDIHQDVITRPVDFTPLRGLLHDEFSVCVVLAYDELFTAQSCHEDFPLFASTDPRLGRWIRLVARDEGYHFFNIIDVLRRNHGRRRHEVRPLLDTLVQWDQQERPYRATFVLDHVSDRFTPEALARNVALILRLLEA